MRSLHAQPTACIHLKEVMRVNRHIKCKGLIALTSFSLSLHPAGEPMEGFFHHQRGKERKRTSLQS